MKYDQAATIAAVLARAYPAVNPTVIGMHVERLETQARKVTTGAVNLCNIPNYQTKFDRIKERARKDILEHMGAAFPSMRVITGGDPRGASCLRIVVPGSGNSGFEDKDTWPVY